MDAPCPDNVTRMDMGTLPMIGDMQKYGIRVDVGFLRALTGELIKEQRELEARIARELGNYQDFDGKSLTPFKVSSPDHVSRLLFQHLKIQKSDSVALTPKGKRYTTDDDTLNRFRKRHPVVAMVLDWRELDKFRSTYTEPLPLLVDAEGFLHPYFNTTTVATGRLSASYVQTIPNGLSRMMREIIERCGRKHIRDAFVAAPGCLLVSCDLSQIEMRWAAHLSQDEAMCEVFRKGGDIHVRTACTIFEHDYTETLALYQAFDGANRQYLTPEEIEWCKRFKNEERLPSKTAGFGTLYETGPQGLQKTILGAMTEANPEGDPEAILEQWPEERCSEVIEGFYETFRQVRPRQDLQHRRATQYAMVWDAFGRVRLVPEARSSLKKIRFEGFRKAGNHEVQGSAQGSLKISMAQQTPIYRELQKSLKIWPGLQVHDQLIWNVQKEYAEEFADIARYEMERATPLDVPVLSSSDVGENWGQL